MNNQKTLILLLVVLIFLPLTSVRGGYLVLDVEPINNVVGRLFVVEVTTFSSSSPVSVRIECIDTETLVSVELFFQLKDYFYREQIELNVSSLLLSKEYKLFFTSRDSSNNHQFYEQIIMIDVTKPILSAEVDKFKLTYGETITITYSVEEEFFGYLDLVINSQIKDTFYSRNGTYLLSYDKFTLSPGFTEEAFNVELVAYDSAGNSDKLAFTIVYSFEGADVHFWQDNYIAILKTFGYISLTYLVLIVSIFFIAKYFFKREDTLLKGV